MEPNAKRITPTESRVRAHLLEHEVVGPDPTRTNHSQRTMDTVIEQQRKLLEERERIEDAIVKEKMLKKVAVSAIAACLVPTRALFVVFISILL